MTDQVVRNLEDGSTWSQYRLRFWSTLAGWHDDQDDFVCFTDAEDVVPPVGEVPRLIVEYE